MRSRCVRPLLFLLLPGGLALAMCAPVAAQRGGGGHVGAGPAVASRVGITPATRGSYGSPSLRSGPAAGARYGASATYAAGGRGVNEAQGSLFLPPGITSTRPVYSSNGLRRYGNAGGAERGGRNFGGLGFGPEYGLGYGFPGSVAFGYPGFSDDAFDPLDPNNAPGAYSGNSALDGFVNPPPQAVGPAEMGLNGEPGTYGQPASVPSAPSEPPVPYAPESSSQRYAASPSRPAPAPLREEDAVTIVFKDGRPSEQIRNYALTRTALYVTTDRVRTILIDDIDVAATEKANRKAGVDFELPTK